MVQEELLDRFKQKLRSAQRSKSETTVERYAYEVEKFEDWLESERDKSLWDATTSDLCVHLEEMRADDYGETTITTRRSALSQFYKKTQEIAEDYPDEFGHLDVPNNPEDELDWSWSSGDTKTSEGIDAEEGIYYLTPEQINDQLIDNVPAPRLRNELILRLLFNTGLRRGELAQVKLPGRPGGINRDDHTIRIPAIKSPEPRSVTYSPEYVGFTLEQWLDHGYRDSYYMAEESDYLFPTQESEHISGYRINEIVKEAAENAGLQKVVNEYADGRKIRKVNAHTIRHSYAIEAVESGIDVRSLMKILGHEELETTLTYLRIAEQDYVDTSREFRPHSLEGNGLNDDGKPDQQSENLRNL
jgi:integrase/recombinase XerD